MEPGRASTRHEPSEIGAITREVLDLLGTGRSTAPFSDRYSSFDLAAAYDVAAEVCRSRKAGGSKVVGRKIGFTNRKIWTEPPMWGFMYERTVRDLSGDTCVVSLSGFVEPRIEPEIVFGLKSAPRSGMDARALLGCVEWVAHGFEIVQSIFPGWQFTCRDAVAAGGLHGELLIGPRHQIEDYLERWERQLFDFDVELFRDGALLDAGHATNVLDGPVLALRYLVEMLAADPTSPPLVAGEIVSTGTLTSARPIGAGEAWSTELTGIPLEGLTIQFS